jgi:hypothetical protein
MSDSSLLVHENACHREVSSIARSPSRGTVDFDPGAGTANMSSTGSNDIFIQKLDSNGNFLWAKTFGGSSADMGYSITVDGSGNTYTTGYFQGSVDFDPGEGLTIFNSAGSFDVFILKLDASGNYLWSTAFGGSSTDMGQSISVDVLGSIYTTGRFEDVVDFDIGQEISNHTSSGGRDVFIIKMRPGVTELYELAQETQINAFPNPNTEGFTIDLGKDYKTIKTTIFDTQGKLVQFKEFYNTNSLNLQFEAPAGIYLLSIELDQKKTLIQLIKQ